MTNSNIKKIKFTSFDKSTSNIAFSQKINGSKDLEEKHNNFQIPRGGGWSFTPLSFGNDILVRDMTHHNNILEFDDKEKSIIVESGLTLRELFEWGFKHKLFFPVLPGFPEITIGGCIAANTHGKNPIKDGTMKEHIVWLELYHPKNGYKKLKPNSDEFNATCGGLGLTGIITKVKLKMYTLPSDKIELVPKKVDSLKESIQILEENTNADTLYSWHIGSTTKNFEKGVVRIGYFKDSFDIDKKIVNRKPFKLPDPKIPISFWRKSIASKVNSFNRNVELRCGPRTTNIFETFFPLTANSKWLYFLYGSKGFRESQILVSKKQVNEFSDVLTQLLKKYSPDLTIIILKPFRGNQKYIQYCNDGMSFTLNFKKSKNTDNFLSKLDETIMSYDVIPYIAKDSRLSSRVVQKCYREYEQFKKIVNKMDPDKVFRSHVSQNLDL
jgi:decaprenylphospho-beta-D-ribofuranose 2-oxidase